MSAMSDSTRSGSNTYGGEALRRGILMSAPTPQSKKAGALVYLQEELGDARMRCDQLLRYIDKAVKLIEKSPHKDHFFEVAGDVMRGIPESTFKLHKALEAVALAANRMDYEEIKQDLRPEKVEELERVLKDVRVRQIQRRSLPMLNPGNVVEQLRGLAKKAKEEGRLDTEGLATLIATLELGAPKKAGDAGGKIAAQLEAMAHALENPPEGSQPSRLRLAQVLRRTLGDTLKLAQDPEEQQPVWHPEVAATILEGLIPHEKALARKLEKGRMMGVGRELFSLISGISGAVALLEMPRLYEYLQRAKPLCVVPTHRFAAGNDEFEKGAAADMRTLDRLVDTVEAQGKELRHSVSQYKKDPGKYAPQLENVQSAIDTISSVIRIFERSNKKATSDDAKRSRFEEGESADPTENMSDADAKEWKENTDEYGDKFKKEAAAKLTEEGLLQLNTAIYGLKQIARGAGNPKRLFSSVLMSMSSLSSHLGQDDKISHALDLAVNVVIRSFSVKDMRDYDKDAVTAGEDEKRSRFEEGKPADPTKHMDPEDAKEWKENTDEYGDKFKTATKKIPPAPGNVVDEIMSWHGGQGSNLYSVGSMWNAGKPVDADSAEEAYDELDRRHADHEALSDFKDHLREHGVRVSHQHRKGTVNDAASWKVA